MSEGSCRVGVYPIPDIMSIAGGAGGTGHRVERKHAAVGVIRRVNRDNIPPVRMVGAGHPLVHEFIDFPFCDINADDGIA